MKLYIKSIARWDHEATSKSAVQHYEIIANEHFFLITISEIYSFIDRVIRNILNKFAAWDASRLRMFAKNSFEFEIFIWRIHNNLMIGLKYCSYLLWIFCSKCYRCLAINFNIHFDGIKGFSVWYVQKGFGNQERFQTLW